MKSILRDIYTSGDTYTVLSLLNKLIDKMDDVTTQLYVHRIVTPISKDILIYTTSSEPFTIETFAKFLYDLGYIGLSQGVTKMFIPRGVADITGPVPTSSNYLQKYIEGFYSSDGSSVVVKHDTTTFTFSVASAGSTTVVVTPTYGTSEQTISSLTDTVVKL